MSDLAANPGLVLRGDASQEVQAHFADVRSLERERRRMRRVGFWGGWMMAGMMTGVAGLFAGIYLHRPVPRDQLYVAVMHDDGTYEPPVMRDDLTRSQRSMVLRYTLGEYIRCREEYSWESINALYRRCSAMSDLKEQARYQQPILDDANPQNPYRLYGTGASAGRAEVVAMRMQIDPSSPNAVNAFVAVRLTPPDKLTAGGGTAAPKRVRKVIHLTWDDPDIPLPMEVQQMFDPAGIVITHYASDLDPDSPRTN
jgi:hypothetical protein